MAKVKEKNMYRVELAERTMRYSPYDKDDCTECAIVDLISDMLHLAQSEGLDPAEVLRMANTHYEEEK